MKASVYLKMQAWLALILYAFNIYVIIKLEQDFVVSFKSNNIIDMKVESLLF